MKAKLIYRVKEAYLRGVIEAVIWEVPEPVQPSVHGIKYRLVYLVDEKRLVGYDNERGKGDHKHLRGVQSSYEFTDVPTLLHDFLRDIEEVES